MKHRPIYFLLVILIIYGCKNISNSNETTANEDIEVYPITLNVENILQMKDERLLSDFFTSIEYIPFETNSNSLITRIAHIIKLKDKLIVQERNSAKMFDHKGNYIKDIIREGGGPGDFYMDLCDISVNKENNRFFLLDYRKTIHFDENGDFLYSFPASSGSSATFSQDAILQYISNPILKPGDTTIQYSLRKIDLEGNELCKYVNRAPRYIDGVGSEGSTCRFYEYNEDIYYGDFLNGNDTVYKIKKNYLEPYLYIDLGEYRFDYSMDLTWVQNGKYMNELRKLSAKSLGIGDIVEDDSHIFIQVGGKDLGNFYTIYEKQNKKLINLSSKITNDLDGGINFFPRARLDDDIYIMWIYAEDFKEEIISDAKDKLQKYGDKYNRLYQMAVNMEFDDNPILIIAKK